MIKIEKVIKGLECRLECGCIQEDHCNSDCPYLGDPRACFGLDEDTLALLKAQRPEAMDVPKPDNDIGCWYDITHNYTLEQVVNALKSREFCKDAVSRKYLLDQSYSIKFQTIDESDEEAYRKEVVCVEDIEDAPSVQPISVARVMTLEEYDAWTDLPFTKRDPIFHEERTKRGSVTCWTNTIVCSLREYGKNDRCWTSRPTVKQMEATPWNAQN